MANKLGRIRDAWAKAEQKRCQKADGFQVALAHQGAAAVTLWARSEESDVTPDSQMGVTDEHELREVRIPRQTGFTGAISENDEITVSTTGLTISSNVYLITGWRLEHHDAIYIASVHRKVTRRSNP